MFLCIFFLGMFALFCTILSVFCKILSFYCTYFVCKFFRLEVESVLFCELFPYLGVSMISSCVRDMVRFSVKDTTLCGKRDMVLFGVLDTVSSSIQDIVLLTKPGKYFSFCCSCSS